MLMSRREQRRCTYAPVVPLCAVIGYTLCGIAAGVGGNEVVLCMQRVFWSTLPRDKAQIRLIRPDRIELRSKTGSVSSFLSAVYWGASSLAGYYFVV